MSRQISTWPLINAKLRPTRFRYIAVSFIATLKNRPALLALPLLALLLPLLVYAALSLEGPRIRNEAMDNLAAIGQLKTEQIETWLSERRGDAQVFMASEGYIDDVQSWFDRGDTTAQVNIARRHNALRRSYAYQTVELFDARSPVDSLSPARRAALATALSSGQVQTTELYRSADGKVWLDFVAPLIRQTPERHQPVGAVILRTLASAYLFPLIQSRSSASPSAETLLIRRDDKHVLYLNDLRHRQGSALTLRLPLDMPKLPAATAFRDQRIQTLQGHDYRGIPVLAAVRPVQGTEWFMVAKVDRQEVERPLHLLVAWVSLITLAAIIAIGFTLRGLWRQQEENHRLELIARTSKQDRLLKLFYDLPFMGMAIIDPKDQHWLHVNDRLCELLGYTREALLASTTWKHLTHPDDIVREAGLFARMLAGKIDSYQMDKRFLCKGDGYIDVALSVKCVRRGDDSLEYAVMTVRDITDRKRLETSMAEQQHSANLLNAIANSSTDMIFAKDLAGKYLFYNRAAASDLDMRIEEVIGQNDTALYPPAQAAQLMEVDREVMEAAETVTFEERLTTANGERTFFTTKGPLLDSSGKVIGLYGIARDITERKWGEMALREREDDLKRAQAVGHIGSWRLDVLRNVLTWSAENYRIFEVPEGASLTYETFLNCVHPDDRAFVDQAWRAGLRGEPYDIEHRLLVNSRVKFVRERADIEFSADGKLIGGFGITQDISDFKAAEQALRDSEERLQLAAEISRSGTWDWNVPSGEIIWSRGHYEILGYQAGEVQASYQAWLDRVFPEDRAFIEEEICRCMRERADYVVEFRVVWPDASIHWMSARGRFDYDAAGVCQRMLGVMADITSLKQAELALREADQRKDEFLAMLAHELRNPLAPIRNAAHVLGRLDLPEPRLRWARDVIEQQVGYLTHLVDDLLDVSRIVRGKIPLKKTSVDLADLVRQACESVQHFMTERGHKFEVHMPATPITLEGDLVRLVQILQNLLNNAAKYTPDGGHIELTGRQSGSEIEIEVSDNGMGINADLLPAVFDLFRQGERTLDRSQGGIGIGLTLVRQLVELHGGQVSASSAGPGRGACFRVRLPLSANTTSASVVEAERLQAPAQLRILVVEDDPVVAESMVVFLEMEGYQVRSAAESVTALDLLDTFKPQVVLLDIGLPGQDGYALAARIRQRADGVGLKLVAVSGYGKEEAIQRSRQAGFDMYLVKPVEPEVLCSLLSEISHCITEKTIKQ